MATETIVGIGLALATAIHPHLGVRAMPRPIAFFGYAVAVSLIMVGFMPDTMRPTFLQGLLYLGGIGMIAAAAAWQFLPAAAKSDKATISTIQNEGQAVTEEKKPGVVVRVQGARDLTMKDFNTSGLGGMEFNDVEKLNIDGASASARKEGEGTGYKVVRSASSEISGAVAQNFETGFHLEDSPNSKLINTRAEKDAPQGNQSKVYQVKWPEGVPRGEAVESGAVNVQGDNNGIVSTGSNARNTIVNKPPQRKLDEKIKAELLANLPAGRKVLVQFAAMDNEAMTFATEIRNFLVHQGYAVEFAGLMAPSIKPLELNTSGEIWALNVGPNL